MKKLLILLLLPIITFAQKEVVIHVKTDNYPGETRWTLYKDAYQGSIIASVPYGHYTQANTMNRDTVYMADSITNISFVIFDQYGDGIINGEYYVTICGDTVVDYPVSTFTNGLIHNRLVPQCMPNPPPGVPAKVVINLDQYQNETSWEIKDTNGTIYASGSNYNIHPDYATVVEHVNIPKGDLLFTIYDTYGDGLNGALWQGQDGSYYVIQCNDTLIHGTDPAFGNDTTHAFVSDSCPPILGCTDIAYVEYNHFATVDDSSCNTLKVFGCTDSTMYNYDASANTMDMVDSCDYTLILHDLMGNGWVGSKLTIYADDTTDYFHTGGFNKVYNIQLKAPRPITAKFFISSQASLTTIECGFTLINPEGDTTISIQPPFIQPLFSYNMITNCGNTCIEKVFGCTDTLAVNYDTLANTEDSTCYYVPGCMNSSYLEYYNQGFTADYDNGSCSTLAVWGCIDSTAFNYDPLANISNGGCVPVITGCMQPLAFNYNPNANTSDTCIPVIYGCMSSIAINYNPLANTDDGSCISVNYGCTDSTMWNYSPSANVDDSSCVPYVYGCMDPTMFNYNPLANTENNSCIPFVYGCMDSTMFNYDPLANTDNGTCIPFVYGCTNPAALNYNPQANTDDFSCVLPIYGCMDSTAFNYDPLANVDNGSCVPVVYGCTNPIALNYCDSCNTDDFSCILPIYGCTDSTMFNYNPLANVDNNSCVPFIYGCTDPSMLNYDPSANTEDFSCIPYIYGCMDSTALNYDSTANTDNGSCVAVVEGCMDPDAYNYDITANVNDSSSCLYSANCITGAGNPYWLNDPCYAWVISVDDYCCENEWDTICQSTYNYCENNWTGPVLSRDVEDNLIVYPNPTSDKININREVDVRIINTIGDVVIQENNISVLDVSYLSPGMYTIQIIYKNKSITKQIIKK
tara:strand:+ start:551 stop:3301 length:2751 start_codon:yes stop_codon:yes gene_type:complete